MGAQVGASGTRSRRQTSLAEINVTPLVDVMLVLLIISMVAAPMLQRSINLELPVTETATDIQEARVVVAVDRNGRISINERPIHPDLSRAREVVEHGSFSSRPAAALHRLVRVEPLELVDLHDRMQGLAAASPEETVFLRADKLLPYGEVLFVMDTIRKAGISRVALVTLPLDRAEES